MTFALRSILYASLGRRSRTFRATSAASLSATRPFTTALGKAWMGRLIALSVSRDITFHLGARYEGVKKDARVALQKVILRTCSLQGPTKAKALCVLKLPSLDLPRFRHVRFHVMDEE